MPSASRTPSSTLRLFTFTTYCPRGMPSASIVSAAIMHISASAAGVGAPAGSASECMELREGPGAGLPFPETQPDARARIGLARRRESLGDVARERRGQVVAQRNPLLVIVLEREHALVRAVLVGQEFAERVGIFEGRRLNRFETVTLIDGADLLDHLARGI